MEERKSWFCRWSARTSKVFYVNIQTRQSTWIKPQGFVETQDELKKISEWTRDYFQSKKVTEKKTGDKRKRSKETEVTKKVRLMEDNMTVSTESNNNGHGDYIQKYSDKRKMVYYYNFKTKSSQWKKPACFLAAETEEAIKNANLKKRLVNLNTNDNDVINTNVSVEDILALSTLNAEAPSFEEPSKLNAQAAPFVPRFPITSAFGTEEPEMENTPSPDKTKKKETKNGPKSPALVSRKVTIRRSKADKKQDRVAGKKLERRSEPIKPDPAVRVSAKERLSLSSGNLSKTVHDRLGPRKQAKPQTCLLHDSDSNIRISECDLIYIQTPPPNPETEIRRFSEVRYLREYFGKVCDAELGLEEPTEAFNRWLLEQKLNPAEQVDPFFCYSADTTVSLYREILQDLPFKYKVPRNMMTCTGTLQNFAEHLKRLSAEWGEEDLVNKKCGDVLEKNGPFSDTRKLISELRESCQEIIERNYKDKVIKLCNTMKEECKKSANKVLEFVKSAGYDHVTEYQQPRSVSTKQVRCRHATPLTSTEESRDHDIAIEHPDSGGYKLTCRGSALTINSSHYTKLEVLYKSTCTTNRDEALFNSRVWCLLKRYEMLRSSIVAGNKIHSENFGLHAALPHAAFELLHQRFGVTFECFASPFNCYFKQFCSAFPDIDCYFGSRGSFFEFKPKSGSFQANPPFSEEVMVAMANHMIHLLGDTDRALMFVVFIPNWAEPMTPAIPVLRDSEYCTNNILLDPGHHQYITGNQHLHSVQHYDAVHGTQVYLLQNTPATEKWPLSSRDMSDLQDAMGYNNNRQWN